MSIQWFPTTAKNRRQQDVEQPTILVVDDDGAVRKMLHTALSDEYPTCRVLTASCGPTALALVHEQDCRPDLLLLDYNYSWTDGSMNGIDIYDALHAGSAAFPIPTIMISADPPLADLTARRILNLRKPFELDALLEQVAAILGGVLRITPAGCC